MKNIFKTIILGALALVTLTSCKRDLTGLNVDPKHPEILPSNTLLSMGQQQFFYYTHTPNVNYNNFRFFTQQWAEVTYIDETNYLFRRYQPRRNWDRLYVYVLNNYQQASKNLDNELVVDQATWDNKKATLEISQILTWEHLVDTYGNIPYFDALDASGGNLAPKYDDAREIYNDLVKRIDAILPTIDTSAPGYADGDLVYHGDMAKWKKLANTVKFRLAMNLADVDKTTSIKWAKEALASGIIDSDADAYALTFAGGTYNNPLYDDLVASQRNDFVPTTTVIDMMNAKNDPRRGVWFTQVDGAYVGGVFGEKNAYGSHSHLGEFFRAPNGRANLLSYEEVLFLKAEAAARTGYGLDGQAAALYEEAVTASMENNGVSAADATAYLAANPYDNANWKKSIAEEAYIALFNSSFASWLSVRRLDFPALTNPSGSHVDGVPVRMPYTDQEYLLNGDNVAAAAAAIGGDKVVTKLFWDKF